MSYKQKYATLVAETVVKVLAINTQGVKANQLYEKATRDNEDYRVCEEVFKTHPLLQKHYMVLKASPNNDAAFRRRYAEVLYNTQNNADAISEIAWCAFWEDVLSIVRQLDAGFPEVDATDYCDNI